MIHGRRAALLVLWGWSATAQAQSAVWTPGRDEYGFVLFEDTWPAHGDGDYNDVVLGYNFRVASTGAVVTTVTGTFQVRAMGAAWCNGVGFHLPTTAPATVTLRVGDPTSADGAPWTTLPTPERGVDAELVLWLFDDVRSALCGGATGFVNTDPGLPEVACAPFQVDVSFAADPGLPNDAPWDPFLYRCADRGHQTHRPTYPGTAVATPGLFGTAFDDPSRPYTHRGPYAGLPWVLVIGEDPGGHPVERQPIEAAWPTILTFAGDPETGADYYRDGAVVGAQVYGDAAGGTLPALALLPPEASDDDFDGWCEGWDAEGAGDTCIGFASPGDCDDLLATRNPGETETWYDGFDADCGLDDDFDQDQDGQRGWPQDPVAGRDCADEDPDLQWCGTDASTAMPSCAHILKVIPEFLTVDDQYWVDPPGTGTSGPIPVICDMTNDGGGWTLVVHAEDASSNSLHRTTAARGTPDALVSLHETASYGSGATGKLSDVDINALRGAYATSILRMESRTLVRDYFRDSRAFNAVGTTSSINQVFGTYTQAVNQTGQCSGTYNAGYHTGLVGWGCYDDMLYGDNSGFRVGGYIGGEVWVKQLVP